MDKKNKLSQDQQQVLMALALLWTPQDVRTVFYMLDHLQCRDKNNKPFTMKYTGELLDAIRVKNGAELGVTGSGSYARWCLKGAFANSWYGELLAKFDAQRLRSAVHAYSGLNHGYLGMVYSDKAMALVRCYLLTGASSDEMDALLSRVDRFCSIGHVMFDAVLSGFDIRLFERIDPAWQRVLAREGLRVLHETWNPELLLLAQWLQAKQAQRDDARTAELLTDLATVWLQQGRIAEAEALLKGRSDGMADGLRAWGLVQQGKWQAAQALYETAFKKRQNETKAKKGLLPYSVAMGYPLCLLAQGDKARLDLARKFCLTESGKRKVDFEGDWTQWAAFIDFKRGEINSDQSFSFLLDISTTAPVIMSRLLLMAWVGPERLAPTRKQFAREYDELLVALQNSAKACGFQAAVALLEDARRVMRGESANVGSFLGGKTEAWRDLLNSLQELAVQPETVASAVGKSTRLIWLLRIGKQGQLLGIQAAEQKRLKKGWGKPQVQSLAKVAALDGLEAYDVALVRHLRPCKMSARMMAFDLPNAVGALIGHPHVVMDDNLDQFVEVVDATPTMDVVRKGDSVSLKITPPLRELSQDHSYYGYNPNTHNDMEALRQITLVQDSAQRVRVFRLSAAQRRAAQLLNTTVKIPVAAEAELQMAMQALSGHFDLQADHIQAAREVPCETGLRAELSPSGEGLFCRLVVAPLGVEGPRLAPGSGRAQLMAMVNGESIGTSRQLQQEKALLNQVFEAVPFLEDSPGDKVQCEWEVADAEQALTLVETLPSLPVIAGLDWPKSKPVRVFTVDSKQVEVSVTTGKDWFNIEGRARIDEGLVFAFENLLQAAQNNSRFVAMGDGTYLALTRQLKERLADLAAVVEGGKNGNRIPKLAAAWLDETLDGFSLDSDKPFRNTIKQLDDAQSQNFKLPKALQAELRPYQEDGFNWASRLAAAGLGGCLADDMGLGKTLQSLALLLSRADGGPALIIAPTSVCGNWMSEANRFAPSLNIHLYSEAERATVIEQAAAFDVVVVSYTLLLQAGEQFAAKHWHTVIADEAQAIKNATAKRTQAVFELNADFRLALSGTPVENRLAELWSIMRFANPGLLGSLNRFNERFVVPIEREKDRQTLHILRRLIAPFLLRRTKSQVLQELPPRTELIIKIEPDVAEASHYEALRRQAVDETEQAAAASTQAGQLRMNILAQLTRLRRAACDPRIVSDKYPSVGCKVQSFVTLARELVDNGHKTLVFSQFVDFLAILRQALDQEELSYQYLDGSTPAAERTKRVANFQGGDSDLFLISLKAGGFGLNLTAADYVVITDPWWNPAAEDQAMGRAHRMGQQRPVTVYRLVTKGTVEEQIVSLHNDKRALADSILGEGDAVAMPSTGELMALIRG